MLFSFHFTNGSLNVEYVRTRDRAIREKLQKYNREDPLGIKKILDGLLSIYEKYV